MSEFSSHLDLTALMINSVVKLNNIGLIGQPCFTPALTWTGSFSSSLFVLTIVVASVYISLIRWINEFGNPMCCKVVYMVS